MVDGVIRTAIEPDGRAGRIAVRVVLLIVGFARRVIAVVVGHDVGKGIVPDNYIIRTAPDENPSIGAKVVGAISHILEGVVGEGQVSDCLVERLPSVAALSIGLNAAAVEDAPRRGRAADGRVRLEICEDVGALVGSDERSSGLTFNPYSAGRKSTVEAR